MGSYEGDLGQAGNDPVRSATSLTDERSLFTLKERTRRRYLYVVCTHDQMDP